MGCSPARLFLLTLLFCAASGAAQAAGVLRVGAQLEPPTLDPTSGAAAAIDEVVHGNVFEGLTAMREDGAIEPSLALRWERAGDGLRYRFFLRDGVRFHDGAAFDAETVRFSLERAGAPGSTNAQSSIFRKIRRIDIIDPLTVDLVLEEPFGLLTTYLAFGDAAMVHPASADRAATDPVGTGPFRFAEWRRGARLSLRRQDDYWGEPAALDGVDFVFIADPTAAFAALMAGDIDGFPNYPSPETLPAFDADPRFAIIEGTGEGELIAAMNNQRAPFRDAKVRRALSHAVDRDAVIEAALFGRGAPIGSHFPPGKPASLDLTDRLPYDPARARALLAQAGYPDGFAMTLKLPPPAYALRAGDVVAAQLEAVGIDVRIERIDWGRWLSEVFGARDYDMTIVAHTEPLDIDIYARGDYYFGYDDDAARRAVGSAERALTDDARIAALQDAQRIIAGDAVNIFIASLTKTGVWRREVEGVWAHAPLQANDFTGADIDGRAPLAQMSERGGGDGAGLSVGALVLVGLVGLGFLAVRSGAPAAEIARRFGLAFLSLVIASAAIFFALELAPGGPAEAILGLEASADALIALRAELGLDRSAPSRYLSWVGGLAQGDFGRSYAYREPVADLLAERLAVSLPLALCAFLLSVAVGVPAALAAARWRGRLMDRAVQGGAQIAIAIPNFWLAIILVLIFAVGLGWMPAGGFPGWRAGPAAAISALIGPAVALAVPQSGVLFLITRAALRDAQSSDYFRLARAKGLSQSQALIRHGARNAALPVLAILGLQFAFLIAGAVIIENVFFLPGVGRLSLQAVAQRDFATLRATILALVAMVIVVSLVVDLISRIVDPRIGARRP